MDRKEYEKALIEKHGRPLIAVPLTDGGAAYVRRPTSEEYDTFQALQAGDDPGSKATAFARYVKSCIVGAINSKNEKLTYEDLEKVEGPAFVRGGACGHAVNRLAGAGERPLTFL